MNANQILAIARDFYDRTFSHLDDDPDIDSEVAAKVAAECQDAMISRLGVENGILMKYEPESGRIRLLDRDGRVILPE